MRNEGAEMLIYPPARSQELACTYLDGRVLLECSDTE